MVNRIFEPGMVQNAPSFEGDNRRPTIAGVTGLQAALNALQDGINGKANASHSHTIAAITGLQAALDAKVSTSAYSVAANPNYLALRDGSGDIHARLFRSEYAVTNGTVNFIMTQIDQGSNNYIRPSTPAQVGVALRPYLVERNGGDSFSLHCNMSLEGIYWYNAAKSVVYPICTSYNWGTFASLMAGSGPVCDRIESRSIAYANLAISNIMPTIAAQGVGGIGTYALLKVGPNVAINPGAGVTGSDCQYASAGATTTGQSASGSWRCMGSAPTTSGTSFPDGSRTTLFLRYA